MHVNGVGKYLRAICRKCRLIDFVGVSLFEVIPRISAASLSTMSLAYLGRHNAFTSPWNDERIAQLAGLWAVGYSAAQIVRLIGDQKITRSGVLGKVRRLGLPARKRGRRVRMREKKR